MIRSSIPTLIVISLLAIPAPSALAAWSTSGTGVGGGAATTMPTGKAPTASTSGTSVTVTWSAAIFPDGSPVAGYVVKRYDATDGASATVGAGCSGTVTATSCTEQSVPAGTWVYTDTPVQDNWIGSDSSTSQSVTVQASGSAPTSTAEPIATGTVVAGGVVSTTNGAWANAPTSYSYQWQRCPTDGSPCASIAGATMPTYTVQSVDTSGNVLRAQVTAQNSAGSSSPANSTMIPFGDNFATDSSIDTNLWNIVNRHGDTTQGELECYVPGQLSISGGALVETAVGQSISSCPLGQGQATTGASYASAEVQAANFNFRYGTIYAKLQFAGGAGPWPAFWSYDAGLCQWPNNLDTCPGDGRDEIDYAEQYTNGGPHELENVYTTAGGWRTCNTGFDGSKQANTYEFDYTPSGVTFKINGTVQTSCTVTSNLPTTPQALIFNLAMGGIGGGAVNNADLPQSNKLYWVYVTTDSPDNISPPALTDTTSPGRFQQGDVLSVSNGTWASGQSCGSGLTCAYQWHHCDPTLSGSGYCTAISGATSSTYTLRSSDAGDYVEAIVTATNGDRGASAAATPLSQAVR